MRVAALLLLLAATLALSRPTTARALLTDPKPDGSCGCCATRQIGFKVSGAPGHAETSVRACLPACPRRLA